MSLEDALNTANNEADKPKESPDALETQLPPEDADPEALPVRPEIEVLRERADQLGIKYRSNTGVDKLRALVNAAIDGTAPPADDEEEVEQPEEAEEVIESVAGRPFVGKENVVDMVILKADELSPQQKKAKARNEARKLVRVRIACLNPAKAEWEGELFTFGNAVVGTLKRFVPFEVEWHVEQALLNMIRNRKYQHFYNAKGPHGPVRQAKQVNEFAIEILDPLTEEELKDLAQRQALTNGTQDAV